MLRKMINPRKQARLKRSLKFLAGFCGAGKGLGWVPKAPLRPSPVFKALLENAFATQTLFALLVHQGAVIPLSQ